MSAGPTTEPPRTQLTYEAAAARVEEIIRRLDSGEASLDETLELRQRGQVADRALRRASSRPSATRWRSCASTSSSAAWKGRPTR